MTNIDKLGEEVAALIKGAEADKARIAPMLCKVWADLFRRVAIISREPLNGKVERCRTRVLESVGLITHGLPSNEADAGRSSQRTDCEESMSEYNFVHDPNYGKRFRICASGSVHFDGETCNCPDQRRVPTHPVSHLRVETPAPAPGDGAYARRGDPDTSIQDVVEITAGRFPRLCQFAGPVGGPFGAVFEGREGGSTLHMAIRTLAKKSKNLVNR